MDCLLIAGGNYHSPPTFDSLLMSAREQSGQTTGTMKSLMQTLVQVISGEIQGDTKNGNF
jgi:hypothetical protein